GLLYHQLEWKGVKDGLKAFSLAKEKFPGIKLVMFGVDKPKPGELPTDVEFHHDPSQEKLRELYCSLDIFLSPSWAEGCQLPPMEAMACHCAVVATNVGGMPDYSISGQTALASPPREPEALARNLIRLLENEQELRRISEAGYRKIREFTWESATKKLEKILVEESR
ncbi:MAG: glycosyltransferase family 4 protein, partial [Candidatus Margulisbacteria bacterium]|nr:glycosyltransferase family 4 protein [Candidatus Margulisiibacteriota bacterium]